MSRLVGSDQGVRVRAPTLAEHNFTLDIIAREDLVSPGEVTQDTTNDAVVDHHTAATIDKACDIIPQGQTPGVFDAGVAFMSLDPAIATVDPFGRVSRVGDGTARILVSTPILTRRADVSVERVGGGTTDRFAAWVEGSLAHECAGAIDSRIAGLAGEDEQINLFSAMDHSAGVYVRNESCWAYDVDLTCLSAGNASFGGTRAGTLISPRHIVYNHHYPIPGGTVMHWVKQDNTTVSRTLVASQRVGSTDIRIGALSGDVEGVSFAKVLPSDVADYFGHLSWGVPCIGLDQFKRATVTDLYLLTSQVAQFRRPNDATRLLFFRGKIVGDSSSPAFLVIDGEPVLVTTWVVSGAGGGYHIAAFHDAINDAMESLGGGYTLTVADLSDFPRYV